MTHTGCSHLNFIYLRSEFFCLNITYLHFFYYFRALTGRGQLTTLWKTGTRLSYAVNTSRPRQNGCHFPDDISKGIFLNENALISIKISLKFIPKDPINNIQAFVQIMAWRRLGDKPLSEPVMVRLLKHICVTRPQWVNVMKHIISMA